MKALKHLSAITALLLIATAGLAQEKSGEHMMERPQQMGMQETHKHMRMMLHDSTMMHMVMDSIAANQHMRMMMLNRMMRAAQDDPAIMRQMLGNMMQNQQMRAMMTDTMTAQTRANENEKPDLLVKIKPGTDAQKVEKMEVDVGLKKLKEVPELSIHYYKIQSEKSIDEAIKACEKEPFIEYAESNKKYGSQKAGKKK